MNHLIKNKIKTMLADLKDVAAIDDFLSCLPAKKAEQLLANYLLYRRTFGERIYLTDGQHSFRYRGDIAADMVSARNEITFNAVDLWKTGQVRFCNESGIQRDVNEVFFDHSDIQGDLQTYEDLTADTLISVYSAITGSNPQTIGRALRMKPIQPYRARKFMNYRHLAHRNDGMPFNPMKLQAA